jgi:hypothetical protein
MIHALQCRAVEPLAVLAACVVVALLSHPSVRRLIDAIGHAMFLP